jgi:hypothetical protein
MSDNAPTLRLPTTPPPSAPPPGPPGPPPGRPSRGPMVAFVLLSILVIAAIGFLIYILVGRANASTQALDTPSATTSSAPPAAPAPSALPAGLFTVFTVPASQQCRDHESGPGMGRGQVAAQVTWATTNATQVWVAAGSEDAAAAGGEQVPLSGNQDSFPTPLPIDCNQRSTTFTMTLVGADGVEVSRTWTVMITGRHG